MEEYSRQQGESGLRASSRTGCLTEGPEKRPKWRGLPYRKNWAECSPPQVPGCSKKGQLPLLGISGRMEGFCFGKLPPAAL
jgi:hypothetical protein